jgi:hypothetical protein
MQTPGLNNMTKRKKIKPVGRGYRNLDNDQLRPPLHCRADRQTSQQHPSKAATTIGRVEPQTLRRGKLNKYRSALQRMDDTCTSIDGDACAATLSRVATVPNLARVSGPSVEGARRRSVRVLDART